MNSSLALNLFINPFLMWGRLPQRHNSVVLDYCVSTGLDTYKLIGRKIDENGRIVDPVKSVWTMWSVCVTHPGLWYSHHNESGEAACVLPIQRAGLVTQMRILDIQLVAAN